MKFKIIYAVLLVLFILSGMYLIYDNQNTKKINEILKEEKNIKIETEDINSTIVSIQKEYANEDIIALLKIENLFTIPIVISSDNEFYLSHDLHKNKNILGATFMDYRNKDKDKQINIYGHNATKYDVAFKNLESYLNYDFFEDNRYISLYKNNEEIKYEIFSVALLTKSSKEIHLQMDYDTDDEWIKHFNDLKDVSLFETEINLKASDQILVLQTCVMDNSKDELIVVVAKKIIN